jgi:hypothetical protein
MTSSIIVGPRLNTSARSRKSIDLAPRSITRDSEPVRLVWWKSSDSDRAWANVSDAARVAAQDSAA